MGAERGRIEILNERQRLDYVIRREVVRLLRGREFFNGAVPAWTLAEHRTAALSGPMLPRVPGRLLFSPQCLFQ